MLDGLSIPNIYASKHYKLFILVPILLLLFGVYMIYFMHALQYDVTLVGGTSITLTTNSTMSTAALTKAVDMQIPGAGATIERSPGGISITLKYNQSLNNANNYLNQTNSYFSKYQQEQVDIIAYSNNIAVNPDNSTAQQLMSQAEQNSTMYTKQINSSFDSEMLLLAPFVKSTQRPPSISDVVQLASTSYVQASANYKTQVLSKIGTIIPFTSASYNQQSPQLSAFFLKEVIQIVIEAFAIAAVVVFIVFRTPIPSFSVVFGAFNDIIVALGAMALFGIPLSLSSIGGLLMLIGYSIDTDMLTAIRILKRNEGTPEERAFSTMKTGMTMTFAGIIAFAVLFVVSYIYFIPTYIQISSVVLFGLTGDLFTTWLGNTPMVLWYKKNRDSRMAQKGI